MASHTRGWQPRLRKVTCLLHPRARSRTLKPGAILSQSNLLALLYAFFSARTPLLGMDQPDNSDRENVQQNHRCGVDGHVHDVRSRGENGSYNKADQHSATDMLKQEFWTHHAHGAGEAEHNGQLKNECQAEENCQE